MTEANSKAKVLRILLGIMCGPGDLVVLKIWTSTIDSHALGVPFIIVLRQRFKMRT